jgi:hypothetical protein
MASVKIVRMMNGEELIGELVNDNATSFKLRNVAIVQMIPTQSGNMSIGLIPFAPYADEKEFAFDTNHRTTTFTPSMELLNNYNRLYGSGLVVAKTV